MCSVNWKSAFSKGVGQFGPKFQVEGDVPHQPFLVLQNQMYQLFKTFIRYKNVGRSSFRLIHAFDRQTNGRTDRRIARGKTALHAAVAW